MPPSRWPVGEQRVHDLARVVDRDVAREREPRRCRGRSRPRRSARRTGTWCRSARSARPPRGPAPRRGSARSTGAPPPRPRRKRQLALAARDAERRRRRSSTCSGFASSRCAAMRVAFALTFCDRHVHGRAADHEAAAAERADAVGDHVGVAVQHLDVVDVDAERVGRHLREGRLLALPVRRRAGHDDHVAGRLDAHLGRSPSCRVRWIGDAPVRRPEPADLGEGRDADADELALGARLRRARARAPA